jgi:hypothetical protein
VEELLKAGKAAEAQRAALAFAIMADKSRFLEESAGAAQQRRAGIARQQAEVLLEVVRVFFESLGLPFAAGNPLARLFASLLRQAGDGPLVPADGDLEAARAAIREALVDPADAAV